MSKNAEHQEKNGDMVMAFQLNSSEELMFFGPRTPETGCKLRVQRMKKDMRYVSYKLAGTVKDRFGMS